VRRVTTLYGLRCTKVGGVCWQEINPFFTYAECTESQNLRRLYWHKWGKESIRRTQNRRPGFSLLLMYHCFLQNRFMYNCFGLVNTQTRGVTYQSGPLIICWQGTSQGTCLLQRTACSTTYMKMVERIPDEITYDSLNSIPRP